MAEKLAAEIPGARLETIEGAGHLPSLERPAELNAAAARVPSLRTASESAGHAVRAQSPNDASASAAPTSCRSGSTQRNVAVPGLEPKWPNVRGEFSEPVQCGDLRVAELEAEPPVVRVWRPKPGQHAVQARELHRRSPRRASRARSASAPAASRPKRSMSPSVPTIPPAASPSSVASRPSGARTASCEVRRERHLRARLDVRRKRDEPGVRVDAALAGPGERLRRIPREAGRVREQMPDRRALGPGRLVEVDRALLGRDQRRVGGESFVTEPQPNRCSRRRARRRRPPAVATPAAACVCGPRLDLAKRLHGARY